MHHKAIADFDKNSCAEDIQGNNVSARAQQCGKHYQVCPRGVISHLVFNGVDGKSGT